jgi:glycerate-2-kinase
LLHQIFDGAAAAAHLDTILGVHLQAPRGRVIWLAAGKAAASTAGVAERRYLNALDGTVAVGRYRHNPLRPSRADAADQCDRSLASGA